MSTQHAATIVQAIDVGYGHVKFTDGQDERKVLRCDSFPSQSPPAREQMLRGGVMQQRDTFLVPVGTRVFEVGKAVALATDTNQETDILEKDFSLSPGYAARLYGALNYMATGLPGDRAIDQMVLGLPLNTYFTHATALAERFEGEHTINTKGDKVYIRKCAVFPQPLGAYADYLPNISGKPAKAKGGMPMALIVDPGYNTVDWFVCHGMTASEKRSGATLRGMSAVLRAVAERLIADVAPDATIPEVMRRIDAAMTAEVPLTIAGREVDVEPYLAAGAAIIDEAAQAIKNSVGSAIDIDVIVLAGGGARLYASALAAKFSSHQVVTMPQPAFANVRGFHRMGVRLAASAHRASGGAV